MRPRATRCKGCPYHPAGNLYNPKFIGDFIPPSGPEDAVLMVIGITGGEEEEIRGEPLVGPSGRKTTRALQWGAGSEGSRLTIRKYNLFNCRARKPGVTRKFVNRIPSVAEFRACCERWLFPELRTTPAKLVLCFGADVYKFLFRSTKGYQFDVFGKAMGHRLWKPQADITPQGGLGRRIVTYGKIYET